MSKEVCKILFPRLSHRVLSRQGQARALLPRQSLFLLQEAVREEKEPSLSPGNHLHLFNLNRNLKLLHI